jgi:hypothetical protein
MWIRTEKIKDKRKKIKVKYNWFPYLEWPGVGKINKKLLNLNVNEIPE